VSPILEDGFPPIVILMTYLFQRRLSLIFVFLWHPSKLNKFFGYTRLPWIRLGISSNNTVSLAETKNEKYLAKGNYFLINNITYHIMKSRP